MQLLIQLHRLRALRFQLLDLVTKLNALEVLPGVKEQACRERRSARGIARK